MPAVCSLQGVTQPHSHRCDEITPRFGACAPPLGLTLSPCSQLHARLARHIAVPAGGLLPHPFTPYPLCSGCLNDLCFTVTAIYSVWSLHILHKRRESSLLRL